MIKDPFQEYVDWFRETAVTLNTSLECVKAWMVVQHIQNEIFIKDIQGLKEEIKILKDKLGEVSD